MELYKLFKGMTWKEAKWEFEKYFFLMALEECEGNVAKTAELVGLERSNINKKFKYIREELEEGKSSLIVDSGVKTTSVDVGKVLNDFFYSNGCRTCDFSIECKCDPCFFVSLNIHRPNFFYFIDTGNIVSSGYEIHHKNGNSWDDSSYNHECLTHAEHAALHGRAREPTKFGSNKIPLIKYLNERHK